MIGAILEIGLSNAVLATILAAIAFVVTRRMRPQWALAVWLLVLAKLLMPPLWTAPLTSLRTAAPLVEPAEFVVWDRVERPTIISTPDNVTLLDIPVNETPAGERVAARPSTPLSLPAILLVVWGLGTLFWGVLAAHRIHGFNRLLKNTRQAPAALQTEIDLLAVKIGLRRAPTLRMTRCRMAPLVWGFARRTTILLPAELLKNLSEEERRAIILHELTHLRRRDHWTKILELAAVGLYWWLPVAWWARRQADRATESCCDAEVVARLPDLSRGYASALVKTIDYLSELSQPLPLGASGFSQFGLVSRRIEMILQPLPVRRTTWKSRLAIALVGLCVLPVSFRSLWAEPPAAELPSSVAPVATSQLPEIDAELAAQQKADLEYVQPQVEEEPKVHVEGENLSLAASLMYAKHVARVKAVNKEYFGQESLQRAKDEIARFEQQADTESQQLLLHARDQYRSDLGSRENAFAAGDAPDRLIEVQQELSNAEAALAQAICPDTYAGEVLRMQANVVIAVDATNRARATWRVAHDRTSTDADPANVLAEAIARENFYRCRQQLQNVMQAAMGDFGQLAWQEKTDRDMVQELQAARAVEWRTEPIGGPVTVGPKLTHLDPPSDEETTRALSRRLLEDRRPQIAGDIQIVKELRTTYADNPRAYPEVGSAQQHHAFYKCTVSYNEQGGKRASEVVYIDHNHLHRFAEATEQTSKAVQTGDNVADAAATADLPAGGEFVSSGQAKDWESSGETTIDREAFEVQVKSRALNAKDTSAVADTNAKRRDATARQLEAMEAAYEARTVTIDQLLEAQRRHREAQWSYYESVLPADSEENRRLLLQAKVIIAREGVNASRRTWQKVYAKYRIAAAGGEAAVEAQAREQFYQCKSQFARAQRDYQQVLKRRSNSSKGQDAQGSHNLDRTSEKLFQAELNRVSIVGPVTTGEKVSPLNWPSDDEVLRALTSKAGKEHRSLPGENHRIVKELTATYTDPPKWHPKGFGKSQLHHTHYKCTIYFDDLQGKPQEEVVYVDHDHLHQKIDSLSFDEFQSGPLHFNVARGITKQRVQFRHFQMQLAREKAKLADLKREIADAPTAERQAERSRLEMRIARRQQELDAAARMVLQSALNHGRATRRD